MVSRLEREMRRRDQKRLKELNRNRETAIRRAFKIGLVTAIVAAGSLFWLWASNERAEMEAQAAVLRDFRITSLPPDRPIAFKAPEEITWIPEAPGSEAEAPADVIWESLGNYTLTFYCPCKKCSGNWGYRTASGETAVEGVTVAVDPKLIPYGSRLLINGHEYIAQDCGGSIKGKKIDIFMESHKACLDNGVQKAEVLIKR